MSWLGWAGLGLEPVAEPEMLKVCSDVDLGGETEAMSHSDGCEFEGADFYMDVNDSWLGGPLFRDSEREGSGTGVNNTWRKRQRGNNREPFSECQVVALHHCPNVGRYYGLVEATVGLGTVLIWDCCVAWTGWEVIGRSGQHL